MPKRTTLHVSWRCPPALQEQLKRLADLARQGRAQGFARSVSGLTRQAVQCLIMEAAAELPDRLRAELFGRRRGKRSRSRPDALDGVYMAWEASGAPEDGQSGR